MNYCFWYFLRLANPNISSCLFDIFIEMVLPSFLFSLHRFFDILAHMLFETIIDFLHIFHLLLQTFFLIFSNGFCLWSFIILCVHFWKWRLSWAEGFIEDFSIWRSEMNIWDACGQCLRYLLLLGAFQLGCESCPSDRQFWSHYVFCFNNCPSNSDL